MIRRVPVRVRLAIAATLAAAAALAVLTVAVTLLVHRNLVGDIDGRLRTHIAEEQTEASGAQASPGRTLADASEPVLEWHTGAGGSPSAANAADSVNAADVAADAAGAIVPLPSEARTDAGFHDVTFARSEFRVLTAPVPGGGTVSVGFSLDAAESATHHLRDAEILLEPLLLLMVFAGAFLFARRTLAPVERLRRTADAIDADADDERFRPAPPHDELGRLALTFDSLLDRLALARRRQLQLTADASHELRTPLSVLKGEAALALRRPRSRTEYREAIERMAIEIERIEQAVEDLLWLARVQQRDLERVTVTTDLAATARQMASRFAATASSREQHISAETPDIVVGVHAPDGWVERLVGLLLDNACKYTPVGGAISLVVADAPPRLVVEDTGPGIAPQDRDRLLQRFERGESAGTAGSGLGLAIADAIVRRCAATWTIGDAPGGGCRITVSWPADDGSRSVQGSATTLGPMTTGTP